MSYVVKKWSLWSKFTSSKRFSDFSQRGSVFGFYWRWTMKLHTLRFRYSNPLSAILEDFFSIRFKPHQVVNPLLWNWVTLKLYGILDNYGLNHPHEMWRRSPLSAIWCQSKVLQNWIGRSTSRFDRPDFNAIPFLLT